MADEICRVEYFYVIVPDKPGKAAQILEGLRDAGVNLLAFSGFPKGKKGQLDLVASDTAALMEAAKKLKLDLSKKKTGFHIQADDRPGAVAEIMGKLAAAKINVVAMQAISAGAGRFGGLLWVKTGDLKKAAKALGVA
ncbi:MAG TPA: hypothetical protein VMW38_04065 [Terriglobia bacterium]|nr:hypothetical protein [Terriglobia bacterium]